MLSVVSHKLQGKVYSITKYPLTLVIIVTLSLGMEQQVDGEPIPKNTVGGMKSLNWHKITCISLGGVNHYPGLPS